MAKSRRQEMDLAMAAEFELDLSPYVMVAKHIQLLKSTQGGFAFAYRHQQQIWYDVVPVLAKDKGVRIKPERFLLPTLVRERLNAKFYSRWYYYNTQYLFPMQACKFQQFLDSFWMQDDPNPHYRSIAIVDPGVFNFRKRPLVGVRQQPVTWEDCTQLPSQETKFTASERDILAGPQPLPSNVV